ncbi:MAG: radical SAM protein [Candidatus Gracilibacteria bacterium]
MITKIFYSLVLFPNIKYEIILKCGYSLFNIVEKGFGEFNVIFKKGTLFKEVNFIHIDLVKQEKGLISKNWLIYGDEELLLKEIFNLIKKNEINDFNFFKEKSFYDKIPFGVVLTITSKCNLFCNYCFNDYDYSLENRNILKGLNLENYKKIIDILYKYGTRDIIITGGEPFTCNFLFDLLDYIKDKGIFIRINTNGTLFTDTILEKLNNKYSLNLMVSMHEFNNKDYYEINVLGAKNTMGINNLKGFENKFERKVEQLEKIKNYKNLNLDILTILTIKNILYLEKLYEFVIKNFKLENWHFFRLYSTKTTKGISKAMISLAIHKIYKLNKKYGTNFKIVDSVPFCVTKNIDISSNVIEGELSIHHNVKTIITTDGKIQIMSAFDSNLGSIFENDLLQVWQGEFVQKMLNNGFLPKDCYDCKYKEECRGGSRMEANIYNGSYSALDPFIDIKNKII